MSEETVESEIVLTHEERVQQFLTSQNQLKIFNRLLPEGIAVAQWGQAAANAVRRNPKLAECSPDTLMNSLTQIAELGLSPDSGLGHVYFVPFKGRCTVIIGYKGLCHLALQSEAVRGIDARVVYRDEVESGAFQYTASPPSLSHKWSVEPEGGRSDKDIVAAYAWALLDSGHRVVEVLQRSDIEKRRNASNTKRSDAPWETHYERMARKSALRALLNGGLVPLSTTARKAVEYDTSPEPIQVEVEQAPVLSGDDALIAMLSEPVAQIPEQAEVPSA